MSDYYMNKKTKVKIVDNFKLKMNVLLWVDEPNNI